MQSFFGLRLLIFLMIFLGSTIVGCNFSQKGVPIQRAKAGDILINIKGKKVELVKTFTPGIANGLHNGIIKVTSNEKDGSSKLYKVTAICSIKGEPGWPKYDNLYGNLINNLNSTDAVLTKNRWQFLFHFDGRVDKTGVLNSSIWVSPLKDNLCRKGDFKDT